MILSEHFTSLNIKLTSIFRFIARHYDLSYSQYCILMKIGVDGASMSELAKNLGLDKSTLTRNINILINRGVVYKTQSQSDLRMYIVQLTSDGNLIKQNLYQDLDKFTSDLLSSLDYDMQNEISLLDKLIHKLESYEITK